MTELLNQRGNLCDELESLKQKHDELFANLQSLENSSEMFRSKNESAFRKENNKFSEKSKEAVIVRKRALELKKEIEKLDIKKQTRTIKKTAKMVLMK